jgi:hypothetical protein
MGTEQAHDEPGDALEAEAWLWTQRGYEPTDGEPGEWMTLTHPDGRKVDLDVQYDPDGNVGVAATETR